MPAVVFLNTSLTVLLPLLKTASGRYTEKKIFSILHQPELVSKLFTKQIRSLEKCGNVPEAIEDRKRNTISDTLSAFLI